jgi:hypothetical protein
MRATATPTNGPRPVPVRPVYTAIVVAVAFVAAGCGAVAHMTPGEGNAEAGKPLFKTH